MRDILERLQGYNPPDRTVDSQRTIAEDIHDAATEIARLRSELSTLERWKRAQPPPGVHQEVERLRYVERQRIEAECDNLRAENERLREALRACEWSFRQTALRNGGTIYTATLCPFCMAEKGGGHKDECRLRAALKGKP